jgi:hypothetical protein
MAIELHSNLFDFSHTSEQSVCTDFFDQCPYSCLDIHKFDLYYSTNLLIILKPSGTTILQEVFF